MARLKGLEPLTHCLEGSCSIQLSYRRISVDSRPLPSAKPAPFAASFAGGAGDGNRTHATSLEGWDSTIELHSHIIGEHLNYSTKRVICQYVLSKIITTYRNHDLPKISPRLLIFCRYYGIIYGYAGVMELADVTDSKSVGSNTVRVRPPPPAPN